jgi:hypothetical protein
MALQRSVDSLQQWQADAPPHALMARRRGRGTGVIDTACSLVIAAPQPIEHQQRSYEIFEKKPYIG